jgi:hypothetical protein
MEVLSVADIAQDIVAVQSLLAEAENTALAQVQRMSLAERHMSLLGAVRTLLWGEQHIVLELRIAPVVAHIALVGVAHTQQVVELHMSRRVVRTQLVVELHMSLRVVHTQQVVCTLSAAVLQLWALRM